MRQLHFNQRLLPSSRGRYILSQIKTQFTVKQHAGDEVLRYHTVKSFTDRLKKEMWIFLNQSIGLRSFIYFLPSVVYFLFQLSRVFVKKMMKVRSPKFTTVQYEITRAANTINLCNLQLAAFPITDNHLLVRQNHIYGTWYTNQITETVFAIN